jgi:hypothetical protein
MKNQASRSSWITKKIYLENLIKNQARICNKIVFQTEPTRNTLTKLNPNFTTNVILLIV